MKKIFVVVLLCFLFIKPVYGVSKNSSLPKQQTGEILKEISKLFDEHGKLQEVIYQVKLSNGMIVQAVYNPGELQKLPLDKTNQVVVSQMPLAKDAFKFQIIDVYRLPALMGFILLFVVLSILIIGKKGLGSLLGLVTSLLVILYGIVPSILKGYDPLIVTVLFSCVIIVLTTYLAHGVSKYVSIALISTLLSLLATLVVSSLCVELLNLGGYGNENIYDIYYAMGGHINAKGLLLSGIIISTLGALNDVTVTQAATLLEIKKSEKTITFLQLLQKGIVIGREHAASMVNTIVLAYAGTSLFLFIFFLVNPEKQPVWSLLNNEFMVEEIVRTLAGTMGILLSVPIVTVLSSYVFTKVKPSRS